MLNADYIERSSEAVYSKHALLIVEPPIYESTLELLHKVYAKQSELDLAQLKDHNLEHACFEKFATTPAVFRCKLCTCAWDLFTPANPALVYAFYIFVGSGSYIERKYVIFTIFLLFLFSSKMQKFHYYISTTFKIYILVQNVSFSEVTEPNFYLK